MGSCWWELGGGGGGGGGAAARQLAQSCAVKVTITAEQRSGSQHSRPRDPRAAQTAGPWFWFHYQFGRRDYKQQIVVTLFFLSSFLCPPPRLSLSLSFFLRPCLQRKSLFYVAPLGRGRKKTSRSFFLSFMSNADSPFLTHLPLLPPSLPPPAPPCPSSPPLLSLGFPLAPAVVCTKTDFQSVNHHVLPADGRISFAEHRGPISRVIPRV